MSIRYILIISIFCFLNSFIVSYSEGVNSTKFTSREDALIFAAQTGQTELVKTLIEEGIDVSVKDGIGYTALMHAAGESGNQEIVKLLMENSADVNARDKYGNTA